MKRLSALFVLVFFLLLYIISSNELLMKSFYGFKSNLNSLFAPDRHRFGDLYGLSYLSSFKQELSSDSLKVQIKKPFCSNKNINFCLVHDSYLGEQFLKSKNQLMGIDTIYDHTWDGYWKTKPIKLDTSKLNILLFEIVERNLLSLDSTVGLNVVKINQQNKPEKSIFNRIKQKTKDFLFNQKINTNLDYLLFDTQIFSPFKELKSYINYIFFERTAQEVILSSNKKYLFLSETKQSVENKIPKDKINNTVKLLNAMYSYYKNKGFNKIYCSIIPNPISIIKPDCNKYNELIPSVQNNPDLKMPMIDIYTIFKNANFDIFYHSDSHWNKNGFQLWLNEFNSILCNVHKN